MLTAADIMTSRPAMVDAAAPVSEALNVMTGRGISSVLLPPLPGSGEYGIVTMHDVVAKVVRRDADPGSALVGDIATWRLTTARPDWTLQQVATAMAQAKIRRLPVVEGAGIVGIVSDTDVFTALVPRHEWEYVRQVRKERALRRASGNGPVSTVGDLMSAPVLTIAPAATLMEAVKKMVAAGISSLLVTTPERDPWGILTKRDVVIKAVASHQHPENMTVGELASTPVQTIDATATLEECSARMTEAGVRRFPVMRGGKIVGIVSDSDILAAVAAHRWVGHSRIPTRAIAADVMRKPPEDFVPAWLHAVAPEVSLWDCAAKLAHAGVRSLPVVQEGRLIGVITDADIVGALEERGGPD